MIDGLVKGSLHTRLLVFIMAVFVAAAGYYAYSNLTIEAFPDPTDTQVQVITIYPGQPSEEVERRVSIPLERALNGVPGLFRHSCRNGHCCECFWRDMEADFPSEVGYVSIYSRSDGIVDWHACLDPAAEHVEIQASHCGMAVSGQAYRTVGEALARFRRRAAGLQPDQGWRRAA